ncbi:MAG TPA: site-2 protease family protein [Bacillota bacterium]|nr:site-2 protease family protein [Bacillota bacterium]
MNNLDWRIIALQLPGILIGFTIHEFAHAFLAVKMGDDTPIYENRYTLNPFRHIDFFGLILIIFAGIGWAKPVHFNPNNFKNPRRDEILVSVAGPLTNFIFGILMTFVFIYLSKIQSGASTIEPYQSVILLIIYFTALTNLALSIFNLLPIPPLDGSHVLLSLIPDRYYTVKYNLLQYGSLVLIAVILIGNFAGKDILPIYKWANSFLTIMLKSLG